MSRRTGADRPPALGDRGYLICSSPRSGSTYLCELLASTGVLGVPREYLNAAGRWGRVDRKPPADPRARLDRVLTAGATPNGIYGLKSHADHFAAVAAVVDPLRALPNLRLVSIRRRDILAQAISWLRAGQSQQFRATDRQRGVPAYDAAAIRGFLAMLAEQRAAWDRILAAAGCAPLAIEYEGLMQDPQRHVDRVARFLGVALPVPIVPALVTTTIQRDDLNAEWRRRFLEETGDEFRHLAGLATPPSPPDSASAS
ncbi:MAG: Stf0 family sulfotransferase [Dongiaceae bacterium]